MLVFWSLLSAASATSGWQDAREIFSRGWKLCVCKYHFHEEAVSNVTRICQLLHAQMRALRRRCPISIVERSSSLWHRDQRP